MQYATADSTVALFIAMAINAAILITAGGALWAYDLTHYIGVGIIALCGGYMAWAGIDKVRKSSWIDAVIEAIRAALKALEKWFKKRIK